MNCLIWVSVLAMQTQLTNPPNHLNRRLATLSSIVIPGSGQVLSNVQKRGEVMLWCDGVFWVGWIGFSWYRDNREQDARLIASQYADADVTIRDPKYYRALEKYNNTLEYNEDVRREARELYPNDPDAQRRYFESHGYFGSAQWHWQSDSIRIFSYWQTRKSARNAGMAVSFLSAALVLNRIISLIDCIFFLPEKRIGNKVEFVPNMDKPGIQFRYYIH